MTAIMLRPRLKSYTGVVLDLRKRVRLFAAFSAEACGELARRAVVRRFGRGESLCRAGEPAREVWALLEGRVSVNRRHFGGRTVGIEIMVPGDVFGLPALLHWSYPSDIEATLPSVAAAIPREALLALMERDPAASRAILSTIIRRLRLVETQLFLAHEPVETRLAAALLYLAEKFGRRIPLTHGEIAEMAATTAETTMRRLKPLASRGLIARRRGEVVLLDEARLRRLLPEGA